jgi:hypothetical protein
MNLRAGLAALLALGIAGQAVAQNAADIVSVTVQPPAPIYESDPVTLDVLIQSDYSSLYLLQPTQWYMNGQTIYVDIWAEAGMLLVPSSGVESVSIGMLSAGIYQYSVLQNGPTSTIISYPVTGSFEVLVPEPATGLAVGIGGLLLLRRRRHVA